MSGDNFHLDTERLRLRPFRLADLDALHRQWTEPGMRRYLWDDEIIPRETVEAVIQSSLDSFAAKGYGFWALIPKEGGELKVHSAMMRLGRTRGLARGTVVGAYVPQVCGMASGPETQRCSSFRSTKMVESIWGLKTRLHPSQLSSSSRLRCMGVVASSHHGWSTLQLRRGVGWELWIYWPCNQP